MEAFLPHTNTHGPYTHVAQPETTIRRTGMGGGDGFFRA